MRDILVVVLTYLIGSSGAMSTGRLRFVRPFSKWTNADQVTITCNNSKIAQYCDTDLQSCRNISTPGVSLKKDGLTLYPTLTITKWKYHSCSCEAVGYINGTQHQDNFTVDLSNQPTNAPIIQESDNNSLNLLWILIGGTIGLVLTLIIIGLCCIYKKPIQRLLQTHVFLPPRPLSPSQPNKRDFEMEERFTEITEVSVIPNIRFENEVLGENGETLENGDLVEIEVLGENEETLENGDLGEIEVLGENGEIEALKENGETLAFGQNGRQERRKNLKRWQRPAKIKKKVTPRATSNLL